MESYKVVVLSMRHLNTFDIEALRMDVEGLMPCGMVMSRDTGYFIKLYEDVENNFTDLPLISEDLKELLTRVHGMGYRMVEFDCDGPVEMGLYH